MESFAETFFFSFIFLSFKERERVRISQSFVVHKEVVHPCLWPVSSEDKWFDVRQMLTQHTSVMGQGGTQSGTLHLHLSQEWQKYFCYTHEGQQDPCYTYSVFSTPLILLHTPHLWKNSIYSRTFYSHVLARLVPDNVCSRNGKIKDLFLELPSSPLRYCSDCQTWKMTKWGRVLSPKISPKNIPRLEERWCMRQP